MIRILVGLVLLVTQGLSCAGAQTPPSQVTALFPGASPFAAPALFEALTRAALGLRNGDLQQAQTIVDGVLAQAPRSGDAHALRAAALAGEGRFDAAAAALREAAALGSLNVNQIATSGYFDGMRAAGRMPDLTPAPAPRLAATPAPVVDGEAIVGSGNTRWDPGRQVFETALRFDGPPSLRRGPIMDPERDDALTRLMRVLRRAGGAAGNYGDVYDNRDRGHSRMNAGRFVQLASTVYDPAAAAIDLDYGVNLDLLFDAPVFGNASTAVTAGPLWRSMGRLALTRPNGPERLYEQFRRNHLYVYPSHRDHDPDNGDLFPALTPYMLVSQGSSRSDKPLLEAVAVIWGALRADVKRRLTARGALAAVTQMVFRRVYAEAETDPERYMAAEAHPAVFSGDRVDLERMARFANSVTLDTLPPLVGLRMVAETVATQGVGVFAPGGERLFDTPGAIARVARGPTPVRRYHLRAKREPLADAGASSRLVWRVLGAPPGMVEITPAPDDPDGVFVTVRAPLNGAPPRRIDVAAFAATSTAVSAPAFFSLLFPAHETWRFDAEGRPATRDLTPRAGVYADPVLFPVGDWRDDYLYAPDGSLLGWRRTRGDEEERFTPDGRRVRAMDDLGRPTLTVDVAYVVAPTRDGGRRLVARDGEDLRRHRYRDDADRRGVTEPATP